MSEKIVQLNEEVIKQCGGGITLCPRLQIPKITRRAAASLCQHFLR